VDASRLVIAGESQGGLVTALYTARNPETVRGAMLLYPGLMQSVTQVLHSTEEKTNSLLGRK
jgi:alpha-beta hydrolase superfamily lysophospholipase